MVVKVLKVSDGGRIDDSRVALMNKSGSFSRIYNNNKYLRNLIEKYGTPLYLNAIIDGDAVHVKGMVRGTF
ncbi:MAG: hypothetical protein LUE29_09655 [Lachnospiraceae bacterium]|nr:hypothetical protein [Lachnospiraceae bacterium]